MIHFFYSFMKLIVALFFIMLGLLSILVNSSHSIRSEFLGFILEDTIFLTVFGLALVLIGSLIVFYLISGFGKRYMKIESSDNHAFYLEEGLFQDYLKNYWKQLFPKHDIPNYILLKKNKLHISADLPYVPEAQQKTLLNRIHSDLKHILTQILGYHEKYVISISFKDEETEKV